MLLIINLENIFGLFVDAASLKKQVLILEEVHKLNKENAEKSSQHQDLKAEVSPKEPQFAAPGCNLVDHLREDTKVVEPENNSEEVAEDKGHEEEANTNECVSRLTDEEEALKEEKEGQQEITEAKTEEDAAAAAADAKEDAIATR